MDKRDRLHEAVMPSIVTDGITACFGRASLTPFVSLAGEYDTAVLVGGDRDLACALNKVSFQGARVEVVSLKSVTSEALIDVADCYVDLEEVKDKIRKLGG